MTEHDHTAARTAAFESFVSTAEVAAFLDKPISFVYDAGSKIPRYRVGAHYRYLLSEVAEWVKSQGTAVPVAADEAAPVRLMLAGE